MSALRLRARQSKESASAILRVHGRTLLPLGVTVLVGVAVLLVLAIVYAGIIGATAYRSLLASVSSIETWTWSAMLILLPLALLATLATLVWIGAVTQAANAAIDRRRAAVPTAVWHALRRAPVALAVIVVTVAAFLGAVVAAPVLLVIGVIGLIRHRREGATAPAARSSFLPMAIPFGVAVLVLVRWSLALPAVWIDGDGVRAALRESSRRVRGRGPAVGVTLLAAVVVAAGITEGAALLSGDPSIQLIIRLVALLVVGALPFVAQTVLYRRGFEARSPALPAPITRRAKLASAVAVSLVLPLLVTVAPGSAASPASAAPAPTVTMVQYATNTLTGADIPLTIDVTGSAPTGTIDIVATPTAGASIDLGTSPLTAGHLDANVGASLPAGQYQLVANYSGDANNAAAASTPLDHTFTDRTAAIAVTSTPGATGDTATLTVTMTAVAPAAGTPGGSVTVTGGGHTWGPIAVDGSGVATVPVDLAGLGTRALLVTYNGDGAFPVATSSYTVPRIVTTMHVFGSNVRSAGYGDSETFDGTVSTTTGVTPTGQVQLIWNFAVVATTTLVGGAFSITTTQIGAGSGPVVLSYLGDASSAPSDNSAALIQLGVAKAAGTQTITFSPSPIAIGDAGSLISTFPALGAGATGFVTFNTTTGDFLGTVPIVGGVATQSWIPTAATTFVTATYNGDHNFAASTSSATRIDADRAPVTVSLADPGPISFGDLFSLTATVKVGASGLRADHTLDFVTSTGTVLKSGIAVDPAGVASADFCARSTGCPSGYVVLGAADFDIVARYSESNTNLLGTATYQYRPSNSATTTTLVVTPSPTILFGSGIHLKATVSTANPAVVPTGSVSFYGVEPGGALSFLTVITLVNGVAEGDTASGTGSTDLRWPQNAVKAIYSAGGAPFAASNSSVTVAVQRVGTSAGTVAIAPAVNTATTVEVTLSHDPGVSADYTGSVTITSDTGASCTRYPASGSRTVSCPFTWTTTGAHTLTTSYSGDLVYLPVADTVTSVNVGATVRTPVLGAVVPTSALVGDDVTVTWTRSEPSMTGTVTIFGGSSQWCAVPVAAQSCTGQFIASDAGSSSIIVRYSGDASWGPVETTYPVTVTRCATLDVRPNNPAQGSVSIDTPPNCGAGYRPGTIVQVTAVATAPNQFVTWLGYRPPAPNLVAVDSSATTRFVVTTDSQTWVRVAQFRVPCSTVTALAAGYGGISVYPASNCTTDAGAPGYLYGTPVTIYPDGQDNPSYGEPDAFWDFGALPAGGTKGTDSVGRPLVHLTVTQSAVIRVNFGPVCRVPNIVFAPATPGNDVTASPDPNCSSTGAPGSGSAATGYLRYTHVTAHASPGDPTLAIDHWSINGTPAPELGTSSDLPMTIDQNMPTYTATLVHCFLVDVKVDGVTDRNNDLTGAVKIDGTKCPDGSARYLGGSQVTLTPQVLTKGTQFNGWDEQRIKAEGPTTGDTGDVTDAALTFTLNSDVHKSAGFFDQSACSTLTNLGSPGLLTFDDSGCGPGSYLDFRKQQAAIQGVDPSTLSGTKWDTALQTEVHKPGALNVYVSIHGDSSDCGKSPQDRDGFAFLGIKNGTFQCRVTGPVQVDASVCQPLNTVPTFTVAGRPGVTYGADSMPGTFYLTGPDGIVRPTSNYSFGSAIPVIARPGDQYDLAAVSGPCAATPNLFAPNSDVLLYAGAPSSGFTFDGWTDSGPTPVAASPMHWLTTDTATSQAAHASYTVTCATVSFGEGIHIIGDAPRCPGSSEADNSFIVGTSIAISADYRIGNRTIQKFTSGVAANQIGQDPATLDWSSYVNVAPGAKVTALYQSQADLNKTAIITGLKFGAGIVAVVAPVVLGAIFPPVGMVFAGVGALAGISSFIPGGGKAEAVFDLVNPTKITACIARWGFDNTGHPDGHNIGAIVKTAKEGLTQAKNALTPVVETEDALAKGPSFLAGAGKVAGAAASIGYGLYSAGIGGALTQTQPETVEELAGRSTITGCLDHEWRITGANLSGGG